MMTPGQIFNRRLQENDAEALASFYNGLSAASLRTFCPLGAKTTLAACADAARRNQPEMDDNFDLVALLDGPVIGWSFVWNLKSAEPLFGIGVADAFHGRGVGAALMDQVMQEARARKLPKVFLTVVRDNHVAWRMYEKRGFVRCGEFIHVDGLPYYRMVAIPALASV